MRGILVWVACAAIMFLTACSSPTNEPSTVTVTAPSLSSAPSSSNTPAATSTPGHGGINDQDRVFFATLEKDHYFDNVPRDSLIESAHVFCDRSNQGEKAAALQDLIDAGMALEHAANFAYAAVLAYCPNQLSGVQ